MKRACILQPDYSTTDVDYKNYDPPRDLTSLLPDFETTHVFLNKLSVYRQLKELKKKEFDIFVNLCEGYLDWSVPSIDVIHSLELLNLPYTGPNADLYDPTKELMKYVAYCCGIKTPAWSKITQIEDLLKISQQLTYPLFVKPGKAGDSLGIDQNSLVYDEIQLKNQVLILLEDYEEVLVEEYIAGQEFTVLVAAGEKGKDCRKYTPLEFVFPEGKTFKTYSLKTSELHKECNLPCTDEKLSTRLQDAAERIFREFNGVGYARLDFRVDAFGQLFFLEINFTCSVFYEDGYEGSADYILTNEPGGKKEFLNQIILEGIARHRRKQQKYWVKGNSIAGYGIYARFNFKKGEIIFHNEARPHRLVTRSFVEQHWTAEEISNFKRYAWPISKEVYVMWDENPVMWAPQNHSCDPNTRYSGLNIVATRNIVQGEELSLDYTLFENPDMESFICNCGTPNCKKVIQAAEASSKVPVNRNSD